MIKSKYLVFCVVVSVLATSTQASREFRDNKMSAAKLNYCEYLTKRLGHRSYDRNWVTRESGLDFARPNPSEWELRVDLNIWFKLSYSYISESANLFLPPEIPPNTKVRACPRALPNAESKLRPRDIRTGFTEAIAEKS